MRSGRDAQCTVRLGLGGRLGASGGLMSDSFRASPMGFGGRLDGVVCPACVCSRGEYVRPPAPARILTAFESMPYRCQIDQRSSSALSASTGLALSEYGCD